MTLPRRTAADEVERKALEGLVAADNVVAYGVDDQPEEFVVLRQERWTAVLRCRCGGWCAQYP